MLALMSSTDAEPHGRTDSFQERYLRAYRWMLLARIAEEKVAALYRAGKIVGGVFLGRGQEALSAATGLVLRPGDIFAPLIRDQAGRFAFGEDMLDFFRTYLGSRLGPMRGRDGNIHRGRPLNGQYAMISHLGAMISAVAGALMARRMKGQHGTIGATCIGEGGTSTGAFHEALNLAAVEKLPLVVVVANNQYAYSTTNDRQFACADLADRARGYGIESHSVDGTDLSACLDALTRAADRARGGHGPQLIVGTLLRLVGHGEHDDASYMDPQARKNAVDCLIQAEKHILAEGWATTAELKGWRAEATAKVDEAVSTTLREPTPDPNEEEWAALSTARLRDSFIGE